MRAAMWCSAGPLIVAMILIIQAGFLGFSRTLYSMAGEKNLPAWFSRTNRNGMSTNSMLFVSLFNFLPVFIVWYSGCVNGSGDTSMTVLSASATGYCLANGIALVAYVKTKTSPRFKDLAWPFSASRGWKYTMAVMVGLIPLGSHVLCTGADICPEGLRRPS